MIIGDKIMVEFLKEYLNMTREEENASWSEAINGKRTYSDSEIALSVAIKAAHPETICSNNQTNNN